MFVCLLIVLFASSAHAYEGGSFQPAPASAPVAAPVLTKPPAVAQFNPAEYPASEKGKGTVTVILTLDLDAQGNVTKAVSNAATDPFVAAALAAAPGIKFTPAEVDNKPSPIRLEFKYVFTEDIAVALPSSQPASTKTNAGTAVLNGDIREAGSRLRLEDVAVRYVSGDFAVETTTDSKGRFFLRDLPPGEGVLILSTLKHRTKRETQSLKENEETAVRVYLQREVLDPFETVVLGKREQKEVTKRVISREELAKLPGSYGDPLRAIQNMPSVARPPFLSGNLVIRGASPNSSEFYIDGMRLPALYHFAQGPSVIQERMIEDITFLPCCFSTRYGRATAGVVEVQTRQPEVRKWSGRVSADLGVGQLFLEAPITDKTSLAVAGRISYLHLLIPPVLNLVNPSVPGQVRNPTLLPVYGDYQVRFIHQTDHAGTFSLLVFGSNDYLKLAQEPTQQTGTFNPADLNVSLQFHTIQPKWVLKLSPNVTNTFTMQGTYAVNAANTPDVSFAQSDWILGVRNEVVAKLSPQVNAVFGSDFQYDQAGLATKLPDIGLAVPRVPQFPSPGEKNAALRDYKVNQGILEWGFYGELELKLGKLRLIPGLRLEEIVYAGRQRQALMPRLSAKYKLLDNVEIKAAAGLFQKRPELLNILEQFGNPDLQLQSAFHSTLGVEYQITQALSLEVSGFFNYLWDEAAATSAYAITADGNVRPLLYDNRQIGRVYGAELMLRHKPYKNFFGWVAYTLSRSERNNGDGWFLFNFDQTHILILVGSYILPYGFTVGARFRVVSGNPATLPAGSVYNTDTAGYQRVNQGFRTSRLPTFHQLDLRLDKAFVFDTWKLTAYLDVQNVYNQGNAEFSQFSYDFTKQQFFTGLPVLPFLGLAGEF